MLRPEAMNAAPKNATQNTRHGIHAGIKLAIGARARKWSTPKTMSDSANRYRLARASQPGVTPGPGASHARQESARGSKTPVRSDMLPRFTAFLGTSRPSVQRNSRPPSVIPAVRAMRFTRRPAAPNTGIPPNAYASHGIAGSHGITGITLYCGP